MDTASLYSGYQVASAQLLADSCAWSPPAPRTSPAPLLVYPLPGDLPETPTWNAPVHAFAGVA